MPREETIPTHFQEFKIENAKSLPPSQFIAVSPVPITPSGKQYIFNKQLFQLVIKIFMYLQLIPCNFTDIIMIQDSHAKYQIIKDNHLDISQDFIDGNSAGGGERELEQLGLQH